MYEYEGSDAEDDESPAPPPPPPPPAQAVAASKDPFAPPFGGAGAAFAQHRAAYIHQQQQQVARGSRPTAVSSRGQPQPSFLAAQSQHRGIPPPQQQQHLVQRSGMYRPPPAVQPQQQQQHRNSQVFNGDAGTRSSVIEASGEPSTAVAAEEHTLRQKFARFQVSLHGVCKFLVAKQNILVVVFPHSVSAKEFFSPFLILTPIVIAISLKSQNF